MTGSDSSTVSAAFAVIGDDALIDEVEGAEMGDGVVAADRIVVP